MKKVKNMKKSKFIIAGGLLAVIGIIIFVIYALNRNMEYIKQTNPELARAMTYEQVVDGDEEVEGTNNCVQFDAFFLRDLDGDGYAESIRGTSKEIGKEDTLYMELNVQTAGSLKDAKITVNGENFYLQTALPKDNQLKDNYIGSNVKTIEFNELTNGTQKMLTGIVRSGDYSYESTKTEAIGNNINNYSKVNSVTLTGTYVAEDGTEISITKTVDFNIDWYGTVKADMPSYIANTQNLTQEQDIEGAIDREAGTFTVEIRPGMQEVNNELILSKAYMEGEIPELQGYAPTKVEITGTNVTPTYDESTRKFTAKREAIVDEEGNITSQAYDSIYNEEGYYRYNRFTIRITYPIEAFDAVGADTVEYRLPVTGYYEGYNNVNEEFSNPYKSSEVNGTFVMTIKDPEGTVALFEVTVGRYMRTPAERYIVSKDKLIQMYNGVEKESEDKYQVRWRAYTGIDGKTTGLVMQETEAEEEQQAVDQFIKTDNSQDSMEEVVTNVGIGFSGATRMLGEDGWIKVYDEETDNLIATFTSEDWNKYTSSNPYIYEVPVKHIRIETSSTNVSSTLDVYNIKEIDDEYMLENYTRDEFDSLAYIQSSLVGYLGETRVNSDVHQANYEAPYSIASIRISNNVLSTQKTEENNIITISASASENLNQVKWINGTFLVKLPKEILNAEINSVEIDNPNVEVDSYELIDNAEGKFIKIITKNETEQTFNISIDADLTSDPRIGTMSRNIELYASNENTSDYFYRAEDIYDVNNNLNMTEQVNHTTTSISMVSPNSLLTNQTASNYDDKGSTVVSPQIADIKPVYALVDQEQEEQTVRVGVELHNNYSSTISEIELLGKIPFEGNTYAISGRDLGSEFTTKMVDTGIEIPENLLNYVTVYYSSNENPDRDLNNEANGWRTEEEVTNWDEIKTFLIDLGDYVMPTGEEDVFYYTLRIPNGVEFNKVAYSHHGVYFALDTEEGKYRTQTEPNKLGFRVAEKYNLELDKYQIGKDKLVPGATYSITEITTNEKGEEERGESKTGVTNAEGKLTIANLYAEKEYEIRELKTPDDYELNSDIIRYIGHVDENGMLTIEKKQGTTKTEPELTKVEGEDYKVTIQVEDEVKASLRIIKKEQGTENKIPRVKYRLTGHNLPESGRVIRTDINGEAIISGLTINEEYTLVEERAEGYYLAKPVKFKVINNNGTYEAEIIEGTVLDKNVTAEDEIPTVNLSIENEKIPTYNLQINKISGSDQTPLQGATLRLYKGTDKIGDFTTDSNGKITIEGLYLYEENKNIDQTYTLKEIETPAGYAAIKDIIFKVKKDNESLKIDVESGVITQGETTDNTVTMIVEDSPIFKLVKKDGETGEVLPNTKFVIYNIDDGTEQLALDSKYNILGEKETIDGKEYYTLTTNENGEIIADLRQGLYKAIEVQACDDKYMLTDKEYYFGIGEEEELGRTIVTEYDNKTSSTNADSYYSKISSINTTSDGGYTLSIYFEEPTITIGKETYKNTDTTGKTYDSIIIKYNSNGEIEWSKIVAGEDSDFIDYVSETTDGGFIASGNFSSSSVMIGDSMSVTNTGAESGLLIKFDSSGNVEWVNTQVGTGEIYIWQVTGTKDGGALAAIDFSRTITVGDKTIQSKGLNDVVIVKYDAFGNIVWTNNFGTSYFEHITSIIEFEDGGYLIGGEFASGSGTTHDGGSVGPSPSIISMQVGNITVKNNGGSDGIIIKYDVSGNVDWAKVIGGEGSDNINSLNTTPDKGVIVGTYNYSEKINVDGTTIDGSGSSDGLLAKFDSDRNFRMD